MNGIAIDKLLEQYIENNNIRFELRAVTEDGEGEVIAMYTDMTSASDVAMYADRLDEKIMEEAIEAENDRIEYQREAELEDALDKMMEARL